MFFILNKIEIDRHGEWNNLKKKKSLNYFPLFPTFKTIVVQLAIRVLRRLCQMMGAERLSDHVRGVLLAREHCYVYLQVSSVIQSHKFLCCEILLAMVLAVEQVFELADVHYFLCVFICIPSHPGPSPGTCTIYKLMNGLITTASTTTRLVSLLNQECEFQHSNA